MDHLSKQQLILLALLVSFVTSLATGIFTVSLMEQAPGEVVRVINNVVEKTVEKATPQEAAAVSAKPDPVVKAVEKAQKSIVKIVNRNDKTVTGLGIVLTKSGVVLIDKSIIDSIDGYDALLPNGVSVPMSLIQSELDGDLGFLAPSVNITPAPNFVPYVSAKDLKLGQSVYSISGTSTLALGEGIILNTTDPAETNIKNSDQIPGKIAFDIEGNIFGLETLKLSSKPAANFLFLSKIKGVVPSF